MPEVAAESELRQSEKEGREIDQGILCNQLLADPESGLHLCHAMLLPREESPEALAKFLRDGSLDLGGARVERHGKAAGILVHSATLVPMLRDLGYSFMALGSDGGAARTGLLGFAATLKGKA